MNYRFLISARRELDDAVEFYTQKKKDLGVEFAEEVDVVIQRILEDPTSYEKSPTKSLHSGRNGSLMLFFIH